MYLEFLQQIKEFVFVSQEPVRSDIIFIPGNGYPQMSERAAELWTAGYAPVILPSGRYSITEGRFGGVLEKAEQYAGDYLTEWEFMRSVLCQNGVSQDAILREDKATFTYENAIFSRQVTDACGIKVEKAILCCKNYHSRRCLMYYQTLYPEAEFYVCPSDTEGITADNWDKTEAGITAVMGEVQRIIKQFSLMMK